MSLGLRVEGLGLVGIGGIQGIKTSPWVQTSLQQLSISKLGTQGFGVWGLDLDLALGSFRLAIQSSFLGPSPKKMRSVSTLV